VHGYAVFNGTESAELTYPPNADGSLPIGRSFHHGRFVMKLREAATNAPNVTVINGTVNQMVEEGDRVVGVSYKEKDEVKEIRAPLVVACDGIFSKFRKNVLSGAPVSQSSFIGFVVSDLELPYANKGHVFLSDGAPTLCYPISSTEARFLVDLPNPIPSASNGELAQYLENYVAAKLPSPVKEAVTKELRTGKIRSMPCSRFHPEYYEKKGVLVIGDAWNIRHPITGGGMSVALSDVALLTQLLKEVDFHSLAQLDHAVKTRFFEERIPRVAATNMLAEAIYRVFAGRGCMKAMQQAIFSYFKLDPKITATPVALLACLETNPWRLMFHFFVVALYGSCQIVLQSPLAFLTAIEVIYTAAVFFLPMLWREHVLPFSK